MKTPDSSIADHYTVADLGNQILDALRSSGKDPDALSVDDLAPVDEFHLRGRAATEELLGLLEIKPDHLLLDVGSGLGGTSRYLATTRNCSVVGVDLTEEFCRVASMLSARVGLAEKTTFRQGSALDLPFPDTHFDVAWTEHVQMNIGDKSGFYREIVRTLKPGGRLVFHDIFAGKEGDLHFPVPWAKEPSMSHLINIPDVEALLREVGLTPSHWQDNTTTSMAFIQSALERVKNQGWMPLGLHLLMGDTAAEKFQNVLRNLEEGRIKVIQAVMTKA